jgi:predicted enzyme related to lactoylglutathione lyase
MGNPFVHVELNSTDLAKSKAFYGKLFDWQLEDAHMSPGGTYTMIKVGEGTGGGMMKQLIPGASSSWMAYVLVDDIHAATQKAKSLGAKIMRDVTEVPGAGWLSIITDPTGAMLGLWKNKTS